jgi:hypothetical protein
VKWSAIACLGFSTFLLKAFVNRVKSPHIHPQGFSFVFFLNTFISASNIFEDFTRTILAQDCDLMATFALYCDDSGTHAESPIAIAACFIATVEQWGHFIREWEEVKALEKFDTFHMADFVAKQKRFAEKEWQDETKRDRTIKRLINIIVTRKRMGFVAAVDKDAYDSEVPEDLREKHKWGKSHYTFAVHMCMGQLVKWRQKYNYQEPIQFIFDRMGKGKGEINSVFESILKEGEDKAAYYHGITRGLGWSFQNKDVFLPLQAADILAWESLHYMQKVFLPEKKEKPRKSALTLFNGISEPGLHDKETLQKLIAHVKSRA